MSTSINRGSVFQNWELELVFKNLSIYHLIYQYLHPTDTLVGEPTSVQLTTPARHTWYIKKPLCNPQRLHRSLGWLSWFSINQINPRFFSNQTNQNCLSIIIIKFVNLTYNLEPIKSSWIHISSTQPSFFFSLFFFWWLSSLQQIGWWCRKISREFNISSSLKLN